MRSRDAYEMVLAHLRDVHGYPDLLATHGVAQEQRLEIDVSRVACQSSKDSELRRACEFVLSHSIRTFTQWIRREQRRRATDSDLYLCIPAERLNAMTREQAMHSAQLLARSRPGVKYVVVKPIAEAEVRP